MKRSQLLPLSALVVGVALVAHCHVLATSEFTELYTLKAVPFEAGAFEIGFAQLPALQHNLGYMKRFPSATFELEGYAGADEPVHQRFALSQERAESVKAYLIENGIDSARLTTYACASSFTGNPAASATPLDRSVNFRATKLTYRSRPRV